MTIPLRLADVRLAWEARDPDLVRLVTKLAAEPDDQGQEGPPPRPGAPTFASFLAEMRSKAFQRKPPAEQEQYRVEQIKTLESPDAEVPLSDRLRMHTLLAELWHDNGPDARAFLLAIIAEIPLRYGPWRALKRIFKEAEAREDTEVLGALAARIDAVAAGGEHEVGINTLNYLRRRAWRYLRRLAVRMPAAYPDAVVDVLAWYPEGTSWGNTWVANHIFYHESVRQSSRGSSFGRSSNLLKDRAFAELWKRTPRPLFSLLERARCDLVRSFATSALKTDFRAMLREVEPSWVARLVDVESRSTDEFVVWILKNVPRFEQAAFKSLGLHQAVLKLFDSPSREACQYAADYARTHARDLPVEELVRLANNPHSAVRGLAGDLLLSRDPRTEVGLEIWGQLLETEHGHAIASKELRKHFGARELTPDWFKARLLSPYEGAFEFARDRLEAIHPRAKLGVGYFHDLIEAIRPGPRSSWALPVVLFAREELARFDRNAIDPEILKRLVLNPATAREVWEWVDEGALKANALPLDFLKAVAFHPDWEIDPWVAELKRKVEWARELSFREDLSDRVLQWLRDVRQFLPGDLGFDWLLKLAMRGEARYHDFAVETMIRGFVPADFARPGESGAATPAVSAEATGQPTVDLKGASFLFTGKMATMPRNEAEKKVREAGGAVASSVTAKLYYLVIGDEGSPLYGNGKKGSKQVKAESLNAEGANIKIISETAFLKMMTGGVQETSADATLAGCERLWEMAVTPGPADAALAKFAIQYLRRHHPDIALEETDRPVDPGAEIPPEFLTFERVRPLFNESRRPLRELALEFGRWELARWSPPVEALIALAETPYPEVRQFVSMALLADDAPEHKRYRIAPDVLTPEAVYRFCESADESTRDLGMRLIARSPRLRVPEEMFRLTESPDRKMRAFVIRSLWSLYRDRGITEGWKPFVPRQTTVGAAARKAAAGAADSRGQGAPDRPEQWPASQLELWSFLRRTLFEISPARPELAKDQVEGAERIKPLPARKAKLALVEVLRDLAIEEPAFARGVLPLLREFMTTRGASEQAACLVAVTRIRHAHPGLERSVEEVLS